MMRALSSISLCFSVMFCTSLAAIEKTSVADLKQETGILSPSVGQSVWQMALGLLFVLVLIFFLAWLMRRVTGIQGTRQHIKIISAVNVGARERAVLVEVAGEQLLLGVASGQVSLLHKVATPIVANEIPSNKDFAAKLQNAVASLKKKSDSSESDTHPT